MATFIDQQQRTWNLIINTRTLKDVRAKVQTPEKKPVDLMELIFGNLGFALISDAVLFADILWVICEPQAKQLNVTHDDFDSVLFGDTLDAARAALEDALTDFFPKELREPFRKNMMQIRVIQAAGMEAQIRQMQQQAVAIAKPMSDADVEQAFQAERRRQLGT